jgi:hypothetical protein
MSDGWSPRNEAVGDLGGRLYYAPGPFRTPRARGSWPNGPVRCVLSRRRELRLNGVLRSSPARAWLRSLLRKIYGIVPHTAVLQRQKADRKRACLFTYALAQLPLALQADSPFPVYYGLTAAFSRCI